jgi:predicted anti-sigma-YlaC factor YlaD
MECTAIQNWLFRKIDGELSDHENEELIAHLARCASCAREYNLLALPQRLASTIPVIEPSPYFSRKLSARIADEANAGAFWQTILSPARRIVPALASITLLLLSIFAYTQLYNPNPDLYTAYARGFITDDQQPHQMLIAGDITDESVLSAIADSEK